MFFVKLDFKHQLNNAKIKKKLIGSYFIKYFQIIIIYKETKLKDVAHAFY